MFRSICATIIALGSAPACTGDTEQPEFAAEPLPGAAAGDSRMAPISAEEGAPLLPVPDDARELMAPRWLATERVLGEYCAPGNPTARAVEMAAEIGATWQDVELDTGEHAAIRASRGEYALGVTLTPGRDPRCAAGNTLVRVAVFKPLHVRASTDGRRNP